MLNLTLVEKRLSAFRNVHHKESKIFNLQSCVSTSKEKPNNGNGNGLLFHTTQPTSRSTIKAIMYSKPTISEN